MIQAREISDCDLKVLAQLAPAGFMVGFHVRNARPARYESTYPPKWLDAYSQKNMILNDPLIIWGLTASGWTRWSDISADVADPFGVLPGAAEHGLRFGLAFSIGQAGRKTLAGVARSDREFTDSEADELFELLNRLHNEMGRESLLTLAQLNALKAVASGYTYDQACEFLGISRTALRLRLERVRRAFGAASNAEAVQLARQQGIISIPGYLGSSTGLSFPPAPTTLE